MFAAMGRMAATCRIVKEQAPLRERLVGPGGVEPPSVRVRAGCSILLSYKPDSLRGSGEP